MDERTETIRHDIDATRESMTEKIEQIETRVRDTVENVRGSVEHTVENVRQAFDVRQQVNERPWLMLGASVVAGYVLGSLGGSDSEPRYSDIDYRYSSGASSESYRYTPSVSSSYYASSSPSGYSSSSSSYQPRDYTTTSYSGSTGYNYDRASQGSQGGGFMAGIMDQFGDELETLKSAALVTVGNMLRDMMHKNLPQFAEEFERARREREQQRSHDPTFSGASTGVSSSSSSQSYDPLQREVGSSSSTQEASYQTHTAPTSSATQGVGSTTGTSPSSTIRNADPVSNADRNTTY